jgi:hypothetical protein
MPKWYGGSTLNPDEPAPSEQWRSQWGRALRWYSRVQRIEGKSRMQELDVGDMDIILAFFQNCYHVRDWIVASRPPLKNQLDDLFRSHFEMGACRDICNGFKHKTVTNPTHDKDFNLYREYDYFEVMSGSGNSPVKYSAVFADGSDVRKFELFALAAACVALWRGFLCKTGLEILHEQTC